MNNNLFAKETHSYKDDAEVAQQKVIMENLHLSSDLAKLHI